MEKRLNCLNFVKGTFYSESCSKCKVFSKRFKYLKKLLKVYKTTGVLKVHLILNHLIVLYNVFNEAATPLLFFKIGRRYRNTPLQC